MKRKSLAVFTNISFIAALITLSVLPLSFYALSLTTHSGLKTILSTLALIAISISIIGIPLSIVSLFSREPILKRIFSLLVNITPLTVLIAALVIEYINEFHKIPA
ncbi:2-acyl-glycerophospho-ethanolamine acyltransferase [Jeotgalibacillus sp. ET6]|uniref:2-acyl-glycerophospho-ethanolamine acyltransferase n=1 Tax=Jeotgalibacillus sp. ET6 TaxID=3037260 RepID=UPI0024186A4C|nr:2-acyl-glycerophospho-ethanolamine acyltransferase [Jeotgalibacillus sp. ET6]MDG5471255.1 2-acyl-glycerophospho-ethanolamine acyltransferase [Jeotgalibacillus sp. ET6]